MIEHILTSVLTLCVVILISCARAQSQNSLQCYGRVYTGKEVTRRAQIIRPPDLNLVNTFAEGRPAHVVIRGVLCRTGRVTDIQLMEGTPSELTNHLKNAVSEVSFKPAELNWHSVSQRTAFEFDINGGETKVISVEDAKGRLVEAVYVMGNRRLTSDQILSWIRTKVGNTYDGDLIETDLQVLLSKGYFDKLQTRVNTEAGVRGGIEVTFEVAELPVISEVKIIGLNDGPALLIGGRLALVGVDKGEPFDVARAKLGAITVKEFLESKGWRDVRVESTTESPNAFTVNLTFNITGRKP